jgi:hypothetical protein
LIKLRTRNQNKMFYNNKSISMNKLSLVIIGLCILAVVSQDQPTDDQQFASMRRTACLVLSRYHSNTQKDTVQGIVQGLTP